MKLGNIHFDEMTDRNRVVYKGLWNQYFADMEVEPASKGRSTTYRIAGDIENASEIIKNCFHIENIDLFDEKYRMAISGNGEEENKILTLHSSSRCALLTFYNIDKEHTLTLTLNGKEIVFDYSAFEFKNPVIRFPSNIDVVLMSADRKTVLFLEAKFSEYYIGAGTKSSPISRSYLRHKYSKAFYDIEWLNRIGIDIAQRDKASKDFELVTLDGAQNYFDGFKQLISHYVGIRQRLDGKKMAAEKGNENIAAANKILSVVEDPEAEIYLGEILYDRFVLPLESKNVLDPKDAYTHYSRIYRELAKKMNEVNSMDGLEKKFIVLSDILRYSDVFSCGTSINAYIRDFYRM